jgi:hypothetical protein
MTHFAFAEEVLITFLSQGWDLSTRHGGHVQHTREQHASCKAVLSLRCHALHVNTRPTRLDVEELCVDNAQSARKLQGCEW